MPVFIPVSSLFVAERQGLILLPFLKFSLFLDTAANSIIFLFLIPCENKN